MLSARHLQLARDTGALAELPLALTSRAYLLLFAGELAAAAALIDEAEGVKDATGTGLAPYGAMGLAALSGDEGVAWPSSRPPSRTPPGAARAWDHDRPWADAVLHNGLGRYDQAMAAAKRASSYDDDPGSMSGPRSS